MKESSWILLNLKNKQKIYDVEESKFLMFSFIAIYGLLSISFHSKPIKILNPHIILMKCFEEFYAKKINKTEIAFCSFKKKARLK